MYSKYIVNNLVASVEIYLEINLWKCFLLIAGVSETAFHFTGSSILLIKKFILAVLAEMGIICGMHSGGSPHDTHNNIKLYVLKLQQATWTTPINVHNNRIL